MNGFYVHHILARDLRPRPVPIVQVYLKEACRFSSISRFAASNSMFVFAPFVLVFNDASVISFHCSTYPIGLLCQGLYWLCR